ncbi:FAD binding domain-containing protein [Haliangium sp.]|uniref:FAD binding domain-containing protein n=1 Tax=Haliangium sp. TaxID=2663208 RepID=UPI003D0A8E12
MYPPAFDYVAPDTLDEALALLAKHGDEAKLLAGGQSLIPLLKLRFAFPTVVIDLGRIDGMSYIKAAADGLRLGALARHAVIARDATVAARAPLMAAAGPQIADPLVRNLGTLGGSLAHADPAGDWGAVMLALDAQVVCRSGRGERVVHIDDFFHGMLSTALEEDEILVEVRVPAPAGPHGGAYLKLERKVGDFATVGAAVHVELDADRARIVRAGIGLTAVGPQNLVATEAEKALAGVEPSDEAIAEAARLAAKVGEPQSDLRGSVEYKRNVMRVFVERGLRQAVAQARA